MKLLLLRHIISILNGDKLKWYSNKCGGFFTGETNKTFSYVVQIRRNKHNDDLGTTSFTLSILVLEFQTVFADITSLEHSNSDVVIDATDLTYHESGNVTTLLYSVQQWKLTFSIINIKSDNYCGYRCLIILIRYGKQHLKQIGRRKFGLKDITDCDFFDLLRHEGLKN